MMENTNKLRKIEEEKLEFLEKKVFLAFLIFWKEK